MQWKKDFAMPNFNIDVVWNKWNYKRKDRLYISDLSEILGIELKENRQQKMLFEIMMLICKKNFSISKFTAC